MRNSNHFAVDPSSPDAHVEDHFFQQGVAAESKPAEDHPFNQHEHASEPSRNVLLKIGGVAVGLIGLGLYAFGGPGPHAAPVAPVPTAVVAPAPLPPPPTPPVAPAPAVAAAPVAAQPVAAQPVAAVAPPPAQPVVTVAPTAAVPAQPVAAPAPAVAPAPPVATAPAVAPAPPVAAPPPVAATPVVAAVAAGDDFITLESRCRVAAGKGKHKEISDACGRALDARPDAADLAVLLAQSEFDRGRTAQAETWARKAVSTNPALAEPYVFIGTAEQQAGRGAAAKAAYLRYLELAPKGKYATDVRSAVKGL